MAKKPPDFFCEFCGAKVDKWAIQCGSCNRIFDSIKCPKCDFVGKADDFPNGCPKCGFQSSSLNKLRDNIISAQGKNIPNSSKSETRAGDSPKGTPSKPKKEKIYPLWVYLVVFFLFGGIATGLFFLLKFMVESN